jgi:transcriptional regulator with XRE-family HTH domain
MGLRKKKKDWSRKNTNRPTAARVKLRRLAAGLTQAEAADLADVSIYTWRAYEYEVLTMPWVRWDVFLRRSARFVKLEIDRRDAHKCVEDMLPGEEIPKVPLIRLGSAATDQAPSQ